MDPSGRGLVRDLLDGGHDTAPGSRAIVLARERQLVGASSGLLKRVIAIAIEHQLRRPPDVDLRDHVDRLSGEDAGRKPLPHTRARRDGTLAPAFTACHMLGRWQVLR